MNRDGAHSGERCHHRLLDLRPIKSFETDHHEAAATRFVVAPLTVKMGVYSIADSLNDEAHGLAFHLDEPFQPQNVVILDHPLQTGSCGFRIPHGRSTDDKALELIMIVVMMMVVMVNLQ